MDLTSCTQSGRASQLGLATLLFSSTAISCRLPQSGLLACWIVPQTKIFSWKLLSHSLNWPLIAGLVVLDGSSALVLEPTTMGLVPSLSVGHLNWAITQGICRATSFPQHPSQPSDREQCHPSLPLSDNRGTSPWLRKQSLHYRVWRHARPPAGICRPRLSGLLTV